MIRSCPAHDVLEIGCGNDVVLFHIANRCKVLFTLLAYRYERGSVMITSSLPFSEWERIYKDPMTTAAVIDRLVHHSIILELNLKSYRLEQSRNANKEKTEEGSD